MSLMHICKRDIYNCGQEADLSQYKSNCHFLSDLIRYNMSNTENPVSPLPLN